MKKRFTLFLVCVLTVCMMASCGGSDKMFDYNYDEYVTLGNYKGVEVSAAEIEEQIEAQYDSILSANAKDVETGKPAAEGNKNAKIAVRLMERYDRMLTTILIGNNL